MKILDSDNFALIDKKGRCAARDIVQFIDHSEYISKELRETGIIGAGLEPGSPTKAKQRGRYLA